MFAHLRLGSYPPQHKHTLPPFACHRASAPAFPAQELDQKLSASSEQVRQLKELLLKARGTIAAYDERHTSSELKQQQLAAAVTDGQAEREMLREQCAQLAAATAATHCAVEVLVGSLCDGDGEYDTLLW